MKYRFFNIILLWIIIFSFSADLSAQDYIPIKEGYIVGSIIIDKDTVLHINLREVIVFPPHEFKSEKERMRYTRLVYNVKKVYPYSQIVKHKIYEIGKKMDSIPTEKERKKFLKEEEKKLFATFEGDVRNMTFTQGRILIKLINRETGETTYEIIKELKGRLSAFFWQSIAVLFDSSLKYEYDPQGDDKNIEEIVILIENGQI